MGTPCITLRNTTEWVETVDLGMNFLAGHKAERINEIINCLELNYNDVLQRFKSTQNLFGKVGVSRMVINVIERKR